MVEQLKKKRGRPRKLIKSTSNDSFLVDPHPQPIAERVKLLKNGLTFDATTYEPDTSFRSYSGNPLEAHTFGEMYESLKNNKNVDIDAHVMCSDGKIRPIKGKDNFFEALKRGEKKLAKGSIRESVKPFKAKLKENDFWAVSDPWGPSLGAGTVNSNDFTPLLGGPFFKQLYPQDYLRMISNSFFAYHHDPVAKMAVQMMHDFVFGRGFTVVSESEPAQIYWDAFSEVNNLKQFMRYHFIEKKVYGESMIWKLPGNELFVNWQRLPDQQPPKGVIPRLKLIDPSCIWDIITQPEDISDVIAYQWVAPTQYQTYTAPGVPSLKFIFTQIPANQVLHVKQNCVSNEKRGRSDLFASLGYLKRLRDSVNYAIVAMQKNAAWSIDTTIDGNQVDINAYQQAMIDMGTLPPAGSEFVHSKKVERKYLGSTTSGGTLSTAFDWSLSMVAMGFGLPVSYFGTHLSGGQTRASALVATEPVAKKFEVEQEQLTDTIRHLHKWLTGEDCKVVWPELITHDRSAKIRDVVIANSQGYISRKTASEIAARELEIDDFNFEKETQSMDDFDSAPELLTSPLSAPATIPGQSTGPSPAKPAGLPGEQKKRIKQNELS
jgi:hypothetical protein